MGIPLSEGPSHSPGSRFLSLVDLGRCEERGKGSFTQKSPALSTNFWSCRLALVKTHLLSSFRPCLAITGLRSRSLCAINPHGRIIIIINIYFYFLKSLESGSCGIFSHGTPPAAAARTPQVFCCASVLSVPGCAATADCMELSFRAFAP